MIKDALDILRSGDYYGGGKSIEFAKGGNEYVTTWRGFKRKLRRTWRLRKK